MVEKKDNVVQFQHRKPAPLLHRATPGECQAVERMFRETAEDHPVPIGIVFKSLAFMLSENPLPDDLRVDTERNAKDNVILLGHFTTHPGAIETTLRLCYPNSSDVIEHYLSVGALEMEFRELAPSLSMYQIFSLKPARSLFGALIAFGGMLLQIEQEPRMRIFTYGIPTQEGLAKLTATLRIPYE